ncbi:MAG: ABC transporter substrate binding protein [Desulfovibrio sp.]
MRLMALRILILCLVCLVPFTARAEKPKRHILYLNSYHDGYQWSDSILEGIRSILDDSKYKIDLQIEYMDAKKFNYDAVESMLLPLYRQKFANEKFDVVIASDNDAFQFATQHREVFFPNAPLVFCGVNDLDAVDVQHGNVTGIEEHFDLVRTLDVALALHPNNKRMIVVGDKSSAGLAIKSQIESIVPMFEDRLQVDYWIQMSMEEVLNRVAVLPEDTFLFFIPYYQIINGRFYTAEEVMSAIYKKSSVPIYTAWEFLLGHGAVGGRLLSGFQHGQAAAEMSLSILDGTSPNDIPIIRDATGEYLFDYNVMQRLGIDEEKLPEESRVINTPDAFYELPKDLFQIIVVSFVLLVVALVLLLLNMIERRRVERKVKDQLAFQGILMDAIPQLVSWKDVKGRFLGVNRAFAEFFGVEEDKGIVGKDFRDIVRDPDYVKWVMGVDEEVIKSQQGVNKVKRKLLDSHGKPAWLEANKVPIFDQSKRLVGVLTTAENITKERNLEKQLIQSQKMEAVGTLAGGIAHDFNNILTSIINSTELAASDVEPGSVTEKDLNRVLKVSRRAGGIVKQILAFSRPSTEGFRNTDIGAVIREVLGLFQATISSNISIRTKIAETLPSVHADPSQMHQVVMNLCTNALYALRETGGTIKILTERTVLNEAEADMLGLEQGEYVHLVVEDNGFGVPAAIVDNIFEPFFSTKDKSEGSGLGLAVVHGIIMSHKGGVKVSNVSGGGALFSVYLPTARGNESKVESPTTVSLKNGLNVLFVEDDTDQLETIPRLLKAFGCRVTALADPKAAAELVEKDPTAYDLIMTDYDMPRVTGAQLAAMVAEYAPHIPIVLISGREDVVGEAENHPNIRKVMIKPYDKSDLSELLNDMFN